MHSTLQTTFLKMGNTGSESIRDTGSESTRDSSWPRYCREDVLVDLKKIDGEGAMVFFFLSGKGPVGRLSLKP